MKRLIQTYLFLLLLGSCATDDLMELASPQLSGQALSIVPSLYQGEQQAISGQTRADAKDDDDPDIQEDDLVAARDALRENYFGSLDIFVKEQGHDDVWFRQYHLKAGDNDPNGTPYTTDADRYDGTSLLDQARQLLANNWIAEGYSSDKQYTVYVTANNPHTHSDLASQAELFALSTYEANVLRYFYSPTSEDGSDPVGSFSRRLDERTFLMDGKIADWSPNEDLGDQVFDVDLKRAAAKIIVNIHYDGEHQTVLMKGEKDSDEPEKENGKNVYVSLKDYLNSDIINREPGTPRWKYVNFGVQVADVSDGSYQLPIDEVGDETKQAPFQTYSRNFNAEKVAGDAEKSNIESTYQIVTYSYPFSWAEDRNKAPYILFSVAYTKKDNPEDYEVNYYRIPVCDESKVDCLDRNNIYIVDVSIASLGSQNESFELQDEQLRIEYHVIPWTKEAPGQVNSTTYVDISDTQYFMVTPTTYTLKGDNTQSVDLQWFASVSPDDGRYVDIDVSSLNVSYVNYLGNEVVITGTTTYKKATDGTITITSTAPTGTNANGEELTIVIKTDGTIQVSSEALASRAVKDISFTVKLRETSFTETVHIRHFPLDNIQNILGWFSYKIDATSHREYSFNPTADGWDSYDGYEDNVECTQDEYNLASKEKSIITKPDGTPSDYDSRSTTGSGTNNTWRGYFTNAVPQASRQGANSEANAYKDPNSNYWYWGTGQKSGNSSDYDWTTGDWFWGYTYYQYSTYNRRIFYKDHYYARRYYRDVEDGFTNWVIWNRDSQTPYATSKTVKDHMMAAKVYDGGKIYEITETGSAGNFKASHGTTASAYTNRQMYVIQLTSTSSDYAIGYPVVSNYESQDNVVSPSFMLASQLGALQTNQPLSFDNAKEHCGKYIEVDEDGYVYRNWRLPTVGEIEAIIKYQSDAATKGITMATILTGRYYWALNGTSPLANSGDTREYYWVRCVRDLTLDEVKKLNGE